MTTLISCEQYCNAQETPAEKRAREQLERTRAKEAEKRENARGKIVQKVASRAKPPRDAAEKLLNSSSDRLPPMIVSDLQQHVETLDKFLDDEDPDLQDRCANVHSNSASHCSRDEWHCMNASLASHCSRHEC
jgi:hypothetical protein